VIREHLPQRWKRCATQNRGFSAPARAKGGVATGVQRRTTNIVRYPTGVDEGPAVVRI